MNEKIEVRIAEDKNEIALALEIRKKVFQDEQGIDEFLDFDGKDENSDLFLALRDGKVIGTGRVRYSVEEGKKIAKVERMAVLKEQRGQGIGKEILQAIHEYLKGKDVLDVNLDTPDQAKGFYEKMGYRQNSEPFTEVGMTYLRMSIKL